MNPALFAAVAHDLKNELGWLETSLERQVIEPGSPEIDPQEMHRQCVKIRRRLVEFLTLYSHEQGTIKANAEATSLRGFLKEVAASTGQGTAEVDLSKAPPMWVLDERLVALALAAALDNASKFAKQKVTLGAEFRDGFLVLFVEDDGPGLGAGATPQGTGLGTEIARMVAAAHSEPGAPGWVTLANRPSGGCRFEMAIAS